MIQVCGVFDHIRLPEVVCLLEASKRGEVELCLLREGGLPIEERVYMWQACRYVSKVTVVDSGVPTAYDSSPAVPEPAQPPEQAGPKVVVTGCYDWLHSGHVRFFEEASAHGQLTVVVGSDRNVSLLKGPHHPMFRQDERRFLVASIRHVHQCLISSGEGWMDAAPEIERLRPDIYIVNEDGDKPEKRAYCSEHGLEYLVLRRTPAEGLPRRESTKLRGF